MKKDEYIIDVLRTLLLKSQEGKVSWEESVSGRNTFTECNPVTGLVAIYRFENADPFDCDWQRFSLRQNNALVLEVFNPSTIPPGLPTGDTEISLILEQLFQEIAVMPRKRAIQRSIDGLREL
jgi:hypothetical protein